MTDTPLAEVVRVSLEVARLFDALGVDWLVGGSLASSFHGIPRSTQDVDFVADLEVEHVAPLVEAAGDRYYADAAMIESAVKRRASFNLLHLPTNFKIDVFVPKRDPLTRSEMQRRIRIRLPTDATEELWVASPEDIVLQKLHWFRLGDEVSERQWRDALGVVRIRDDLDRAYIDRWARDTGLSELWQRLQAEAAGGAG